MYRNTRLFFLFLVFVFFGLNATNRNLKILHLSFHKGCIHVFEEVARELGVSVTSWYILTPDLPRTHFDGISVGNAVYNIGAARAQRVWEKHKDYFDQFDVIVTSDTAPLARVFLQNGWEKPLLIWVCNRFDYCDWESNDCGFPDREYYRLFAHAAQMPNVKIISYTPYEYCYAAQRGIDIGTLTIRPIGILEKNNSDFKSSIPSHINKQESLFLFPRLNQQQIDYVMDMCSYRNIPMYTGYYNGPEDLKDFKGVVYFPYQWSNLALFENIQRGIVHFVPSQRFITELVYAHAPIRYVTLHDFHLCEWYCEEFRDLFVYFDSWDDLKVKIETTDYAMMKERIRNAGMEHRQKTLHKWAEVFKYCTHFIKHMDNHAQT